MAQTVEEEYMGGSKARVWTYVILAGLLLVGLLVANFVWANPEDARAALDGFLGLPGWAIVAIMAVIGVIVFWGGLKIEADWPEAVGALLISGAVLAIEMMVGLETFMLFNMKFVPYFIPLFVFVVLFGVGMVKSK
jgi:Na+(H+)/acetate symporter ActP